MSDNKDIYVSCECGHSWIMPNGIGSAICQKHQSPRAFIINSRPITKNDWDAMDRFTTLTAKEV